MDKNNENEENETFIKILQNEENYNNISQKILFITTDSWLAQLGSRKSN